MLLSRGFVLATSSIGPRRKVIVSLKKIRLYQVTKADDDLHRWICEVTHFSGPIFGLLQGDLHLHKQRSHGTLMGVTPSAWHHMRRLYRCPAPVRRWCQCGENWEGQSWKLWKLVTWEDGFHTIRKKGWTPSISQACTFFSSGPAEGQESRGYCANLRSYLLRLAQ